MDDPKKKPGGNRANSKSVQGKTKNRRDYITGKPPTKMEVCVNAFLTYGSFNTFDANRVYNDTCLHSCVSDLCKKFDLEFDRRYEDVGARQKVVRYTPTDLDKMKRTLAMLRKARGAGGVL